MKFLQSFTVRFAMRAIKAEGGHRSHSTRKSLTYEISGRRTDRSETGTSDNCVGRIEGKFADFPQTIGRACSLSLPRDFQRNPCGPYYVVLLLATQMLQ